MAVQALMALLKVGQGVQKSMAIRSEALRIEDQADIAFRESEETADMAAISNRQFEEKQALSYLKNGVSLQGSPLLVLEETRQIGREEVESIRKRGRARFNLAQDKTAQMRKSADAAVFGSSISASGNLIQGLSAANPGVLGPTGA